jgi:energy-converting hydrogenase Eha subunit B
VTTPVTLAPPVTFNVKVVELIVAGVIATLKVALRAWLMGTPTAGTPGAELVGTVEMTVGGVGAGTVKKVHG